jgi:hypothetical protein
MLEIQISICEKQINLKTKVRLAAAKCEMITKTSVGVSFPEKLQFSAP